MTKHFATARPVLAKENARRLMTGVMSAESFDLLLESLERIAVAIEDLADQAARIEAAIDVASGLSRESLLDAAQGISLAIDEVLEGGE